MPLTSQGLLAEPLWYTWVNTHFSTLILSGAVLSPAEGNRGNVLTWRLHMPDEATSLIGLHGAAVGLIGWDCGITEREKKWERNAGIGRKRQNAGSRAPHYLLIDTVCRRGAASQRGETKHVWLRRRRSHFVNFRLWKFTQAQRRRLLMHYACIKSYLFCWRDGVGEPCGQVEEPCFILAPR